MEEWDPQKMLDLYIHDYLVRKNLQHSADTLAQEANMQPKPVVINPHEGFLHEWWSLFWDVYTSRVEVNPSVELASTSMPQPPQSSASVLQITEHVLPMIDIYMIQNICPPMIGLGIPNLVQAGDSSIAPWPEMGSLLSVVPPMTFHPTFNAHNVEQFASMQPITPGSSSGSQRRGDIIKHLSPLSQGVNTDTGLGRPTTSKLAPPAPRLTLDDPKHADAGRKMWNFTPSHEGHSLTGLRYNIPVPKVQKQVSPGSQAARASGKLIISKPVSVVSPGSQARVSGKLII